MRKNIKICLISIITLSLLLPITFANAWGGKSNRNKITIIRDNYGVPHVFAKTKEG